MLTNCNASAVLGPWCLSCLKFLGGVGLDSSELLRSFVSLASWGFLGVLLLSAHGDAKSPAAQFPNTIRTVIAQPLNKNSVPPIQFADLTPGEFLKGPGLATVLGGLSIILYLQPIPIIGRNNFGVGVQGSGMRFFF